VFQVLKPKRLHIPFRDKKLSTNDHEVSLNSAKCQTTDNDNVSESVGIPTGPVDVLVEDNLSKELEKSAVIS